MESGRRELLTLAGAVLAGTALAGCTESDDVLGGRSNGQVLESELQRETPDASETALETLVRGNTAFAIDWYQALADSSEENLLVSPYSVSIALAMVWAGARGETKRQIKNALQYRLKQTQLHPAFNALDRRLEKANESEKDTDVTPFQLSIANAIWGQMEFPFRESYLDTLARNYGASVHTLDFSATPDRARTQINEWVNDQTNGTIEQLFGKGTITAATRLVLTNAVYFKANWKHTFSPETTEDGQFTALDGSTSMVPMMSEINQFPVAETDGHRLIELPYVGDTVGMIVILPKKGEFEAFERSLTPDRLHTLTQRLEPTSTALTLPRFSYESEFNLNRTLSALGMKHAFDRSKADFSGMVESGAGSLSISDVVHKTHILVDEKGTEAAAATGVAMPVSAPAREFELTIDRPFLYAIRERTTGTILFLGRVVDANAAQ